MLNSYHLIVEEHPSSHDIDFLEQRIIDFNYGQARASDGRGVPCGWPMACAGRGLARSC